MTIGSRPLDKDQLSIELGFRAMLAGLGRYRGHNPALMMDPVLATGALTRAAALPANATSVEADLGDGSPPLWSFPVAVAEGNGTPTDLQHANITITTQPRRLTALDTDGNPVQLGYPMIKKGFGPLLRPSWGDDDVPHTRRAAAHRNAATRAVHGAPDATQPLARRGVDIGRLGDLARVHPVSAGRQPDHGQQAADSRRAARRAGVRPHRPWGVHPGPSPALGLGTANALPWDHLIYAYLVESTGVVEILREVVRRYVVGEMFEATSDVTYSWMRATEELFFRDPPLFSITSTVSSLRPDQRINRRNAYWRMFGMDLPHPVSGLDGQPWKSEAGSAVNLGFGETWLELLRQVWMGIENDTNAVGANPTDADYVAYLCRTIGEMMTMRRRAGMLSREEFGHVVAMSGFHLLVESDNPVLTDLQAGVGGGGGNAGDRLGRIAQRVGVTPPRRARELTELVTTITGLSAVGAAAILAQTGDPDRFDCPRTSVKHAGLCPRANESGTFQGATKVSGRGRPALRTAAWRAIWGALRQNPVYSARFTHLTGRATNPLRAGQARAAIAAALLRQLHVVVTRRVAWNPDIAAGTVWEVAPQAA